MTVLPNPSVPLVDENGLPSSSLMDMIPTLSAIDPVSDQQGLPTPLFLSRLRGLTALPPSPRAQIVNDDGTPTRVFTAMLMGLPK